MYDEGKSGELIKLLKEERNKTIKEFAAKLKKVSDEPPYGIYPRTVDRIAEEMIKE